MIRRSSFLLSCAIALSSCNCDETGVGGLIQGLEVEPRFIDFGEVPLGSTRVGATTLRNVGESNLSIRQPASIGVPFEIASPTSDTQLPPNASMALSVTARPNELGLRTATVAIVTDSLEIEEVSVLIRVVGVEPPPCDDGNVCTEDFFDASTESCSHRFADDTPCSPADRCVINAKCSRGVCLGSPKTCTDASTCTVDLCRQLDGSCIFLPDPDACDDRNDCTADSCSLDGCHHEPLTSGLACDDENPCTVGDTCFAGECVGRGVEDGGQCDDQNSCTIGDTCRGGTCSGTSFLDQTTEGEIVFDFPLIVWDRSFLHRREVSMGDDGTLFGLDHLPLFDPEPGLTHVVTTMRQCGTPHYEFAYRPADTHILVHKVRREMLLTPDNVLRLVVGIRKLPPPQGDFLPETTSYLLDADGRVIESRIAVRGGETGRSLLPDGSNIYGVVWPLEDAPTLESNNQNFVVVREDSEGNVLWRHERTSGIWSEFLGVAGPRVMFGSMEHFGALDFNTGELVWSVPTRAVAKEMALSTALNLGVTRIGTSIEDSQLLGVEIIEGAEVFRFPAAEDFTYLPRTDPVISPDGRILVLMQRNQLSPDGFSYEASALEWVELGPGGQPISTTILPFTFPLGFDATRREDDSYPTVAEDGITYLGYADQLWAIEPGGHIRWTVTSTLPNGFTGTVPLLRDDGVLLTSEGDRRIIGVRTNGARMTDAGWSSFRHDNRRTNYTP